MAQIFRIAKIVNIGNFEAVDLKEKVSENVFWELVDKKVVEITNDKPDKYDEALKTVTEHLLKGKAKSSKNSIQILDMWFEVQGFKE